MSQSDNEIIAAYLKQVEDLFRRLPACFPIIGFNVVRGMRDLNEQSWITFECIKDQDYTFMKVKKNIVAVYQVIGQNSSFDAEYTESTRLPGASIKAFTVTGEDWNQQILPSILQEMQALTTQNETIMNMLAGSSN